ncbi:hypothetical protein GW17_00043821 [Ensete ventricosum]|nr:hypothetical protein GW17_00043821 [Ensete ventricosum]
MYRSYRAVPPKIDCRRSIKREKGKKKKRKKKEKKEKRRKRIPIAHARYSPVRRPRLRIITACGSWRLGAEREAQKSLASQGYHAGGLTSPAQCPLIIVALTKS